MLNYRVIDRFILSGGWQNLKEDAAFLNEDRVKAILDLQFTPIDESLPAKMSILEAIEDFDIAYEAIDMFDGEENRSIDEIIAEIIEIIEGWESILKPKDKILIKCGAGNSRSVFAFLAYICHARRLSYNEALQYLRDKEAKLEMYGLLSLGEAMDPYFKFILRSKYGSDSSSFGELEE